MSRIKHNHCQCVGLTASLILAAASPLLSPTLPAVVADYTFINIADTSEGSPFNSFGFLPVAAPALNNAGTVAFFAALDAGGSGIFTGSGGATTTIAATSGPFSGFANNTPTINDAGTVGFGATLDAGGSGIFTGSGGLTTTIAATSPGGSFSSFEGNLGWIDTDGVVAFFGDLAGPGGDGIFTGSGGGTATIADESGQFTSFANAPTIAGSTVAFVATLDTGILGIFTHTGDEIIPIVDNSGPFAGFGVPAINSGGTVAFVATFDGGGAGVFTGSGGPTTTIADTSGGGGFSFFGFYPSLNAGGAVAFLANLDAGGAGIFTGADLVADKVIRTSDALFGSTVTELAFFSDGLNDHGDIAFRYELANGVAGIALAVAKSPSEPADLDGDGDVDGFDLAMLLGQWTGAASYSPCPPHAPADLNSDCQINGFDLALLLGAWG